MSCKSCISIVAGGALILAVYAGAQPAPRLTVETVLLTGRPAPGIAGGATISGIGDLPRMDVAGDASAIALVDDPVDGAIQALYRSLGGATPELVFRTGDPAPGVAARFQRFPGLPSTPRIDDGRLSFAAGTEDTAGGAGTGLWSDGGGSFAPLLIAGASLPGLPAGAEVYGFDFTTRPDDTVLLRGKFSRDGNTDPADRGLWRHHAGSWQPLLINGMAAPDVAPASFGPDPLRVYGPLFAYDATAGGRVAVQAWVTGRRIDGDHDEGLWVEGADGLHLLVREGDPAGGDGGGGGGKGKGHKGGQGGASFGPSFSSPTFGGDGDNLPVAVNDRGEVIFGAILYSGRDRLNSVWTNRSGSLERIAAGALPISGYGRGDAAPGFGGAPFARFVVGDLDETGRLAFQGFADERGSPYDLTPGIWWDVPGSLSLVAGGGKPVPGVPGAVFTTVELHTLSRGGELLFTGFYTGPGVGTGNDRGLFRATAGAGVERLLAEGDTVAVDTGSGTEERVVRTFELGRGLSLGGRGALYLAFTDGSSGVFTADGLVSR